MTLFKRHLLLWLIGIYAIEALSFLSFQAPLVRTVVAALCCLGLVALTIRRPSLALSVLAVELLIGSKGGLFKLGLSDNPDAGFNWRLALFAAFFVGYIIQVARQRWWKDWRSYLTKSRLSYVCLFAILIFATLHGIWRGNAAWFSDANAWFFLALLLPVIDIATHRPDELKQDIAPALIAGLVWIPLESLFLFYFFSHNFSAGLLSTVYLWIRRTGVGEVTRILPNQPAFRVFFQSHIYQVLALIVISTAWLQNKWRIDIVRWLWILSAATVLVSFSRSFWLGLAVAMVGLMVWFVLNWKQQHWNVRWAFTTVGTHILTVAGAIVLCLGLLAYPYPKGGTTAFADLLRARADLGEDAAQTRWKLLPAMWDKIKDAPLHGNGFGATVTYESKDPRIVATKGGQQTTYAFEWGWLDFWLKWGILGIPIMLFVLIQLGQRSLQSTMERYQKTSAILLLITLAVIHAFTPYLNHPLGLGVLLLIEGGLVITSRRSHATHA